MRFYFHICTPIAVDVSKSLK